MKSGHIFQEICIFIKKHDGYISNQTVQKSDVYLPDFYYYDIGHHVAAFVFTLSKSNHLQNLLPPKDNLLNETTPETINLFSSNVLKLPQETLVKIAIENYIKKITGGSINESYFLYDKSNVIQHTFVTEISKLISVYGSISFFNKKTVNGKVQVVFFQNPSKFTVLKDMIKNTLDFQLTKIDGNLPKLNDRKVHHFSLTEVGKKRKAQMSEPIETVTIRG